MSVDWKLKLKAFLYQPPWSLLSLQEPDENSCKQLIGILVEGDDLGKAREANEIAFGLDVPPFARQKDLWQVFLKNPCLKHALSGEAPELDEATFKDTNLCEIAKNAVGEALERVKKDYLVNSPTDGAYKKAFLTLWRLLADLIREQERSDSKLGSVWDLLPADPRVPDHSIWDHAATASAFASTWNGKEFDPALLIFTLASAQDFLAAARRTQDLWMGSFLFSYLIWRAMEPIVDELGPDVIIYPSLLGQPLVDRWLLGLGLQDPNLEKNAQDIERLKIANFPNIFTALVPRQQAGDLAKKAVNSLIQTKETILTSVKTLIENALGSEENLISEVAQARIQDEEKRKNFIQNVRKAAEKNDEDWERLWKKQMNAFLLFNVFWVVHPWAAPNGGHQLTDLIAYHNNLVGEREELRLIYEKSLQADPNANDNPGLAYPLISELTGRMLTARKNLRHFQQAPQSGHKCSQCGIREALHPSFVEKKGDTYPELVAFWEILQRVGEKDGQYKLAGRIRRGDRLCAVCLTKRLAWEAFFLEKKLEEGGFQDVKQKLDQEKKLPAHILFPSTATVATAKFKERVLQKLCELGAQGDLWENLKDYVEKAKAKNAIKPYFYPTAELPRLEKIAKQITDKNSNAAKILNDFLRLDGEWLYPESFEPEAFSREFGITLSQAERQTLAQARQALEGFLAAAIRLGIPKPQRYFALLAMDGDKMGEWVTGRRGPTLRKILHPEVAEALGSAPSYEEVLNKPRPLGPAHHRALSAALKNFALEVVRPIVEERYCGKLIYAGGDDVLALLPLEDLLPAMHDLHSLFTGQEVRIEAGGKSFVSEGSGFVSLKENGQERWLLLPGPEMSTSAGAAIAHYTHPLWHVAEEVRVALKEAKEVHGREAWAVHILKRSGEPVHTGGKWCYGSWKVVEAIQQVAGFFEKGLSPRFLYEMGRVAEGMKDLPSEAKATELQRLLSRREGLTPEDHEELIKLGIPTWFGMIGGQKPEAWGQILSWLRLAQFLARGARG